MDKAAPDRVNQLAIWDFEVASNEDGRLVVLGSNDFTYYHDVELEFDGVTFCDLPPTFSHAEFLLSPTWRNDDPPPSNVYVFAESLIDSRTEYRICARDVTVRVGKVHYRS